MCATYSLTRRKRAIDRGILPGEDAFAFRGVENDDEQRDTLLSPPSACVYVVVVWPRVYTISRDSSAKCSAAYCIDIIIANVCFVVSGVSPGRDN